MKSIFDNFISTIIFVVIVFAITSFTLLEMQLVSARHIHSSAINQIQSSYYSVDINAINDKISDLYNDDWFIECQTVNAVNNREDRLVTLHYKVTLPLFGIEKDGVIQGYAR